MKLNRDNISQLHKLTDEVKSKEHEASEILRTAQDQYGHVEHEVEREDPKKPGTFNRIKLTEKVLWDEVFYLGTGDHAAAQILRDAHPQVFEAYKLQEKAAGDLQQYVRAEMGIDMKAMRISDYVKLTEAIMDLKLEEYDQGKRSDGSVKSPIQDIS